MQIERSESKDKSNLVLLCFLEAALRLKKRFDKLEGYTDSENFRLFFSDFFSRASRVAINALDFQNKPSRDSNNSTNFLEQASRLPV
jgi:hypothetical protein